MSWVDFGPACAGGRTEEERISRDWEWEGRAEARYQREIHNDSWDQQERMAEAIADAPSVSAILAAMRREVA